MGWLPAVALSCLLRRLRERALSALNVSWPRALSLDGTCVTGHAVTHGAGRARQPGVLAPGLRPRHGSARLPAEPSDRGPGPGPGGRRAGAPAHCLITCP